MTDNEKTMARLNGRQIRMLVILKATHHMNVRISSTELFKRFHDGIFHATENTDPTPLRLLQLDLADMYAKGLVDREFSWKASHGQRSVCWITERGLYFLQKLYQIPSTSEGSQPTENK